MAVSATLLGAASPAAARVTGPPKAPHAKPVPVTAVTSHYGKPRRLVTKPMPAPVWPAGTATASVPRLSGGSTAAAGAGSATGSAAATAATPAPARAGGLPVWFSPVPAAAGTRAAGSAASAAGAKRQTPPTDVQVRILPKSAAAAAGIDGVLMQVTPTRATPLRMALDYRSFADAFGGDWASRLQLVRLPDCALTTPRLASCRTETRVPSANSAAAQTLSAPLAATDNIVLAATGAPSGGGGDFSATSLKPSGSWQAGGSTDAFTWSYPISGPSVPGGLTPNLALGYDSQSVDGLTSSTNNQASVVGDGFSLPTNYIERSYGSCHDNPTGATKTWDSCWSADNQLTLSLNGNTTTLIKDDTSGTYRAQGDSDERVERLTGATNGAQGGEYFRVTTPDGTQYTFGLNRLPGWASGNTTTNSVLTEPVYATASGQPCYNATWASSWCQQGYRWMLDYVKDTHSDVMSYFYTPTTAYYARDLGKTADTSYVRDAALAKIQYGQRDGSVYSTSPAGLVTFTYNGRCDTSATGCATSTLTSSTASKWPDVPFDLNCASGASCSSNSPSFWTENELTGIQAQALVGSTETNVDSWAFAYSFPPTGDVTTPSLWLDTVTRTGQDTSAGGSASALAMPKVTFAGTPLSNRTNLTNGYPPITRYRLNTITTESGGVVSVGYSAPACGSGTPSDASQNTSLCYPGYWTPTGQTTPMLDWFNKYIVTTVTQQDQTGGGVNDTLVTRYLPVGTPAWHYDDNPLTPTAQRTWDQWRGYGGMKVTTGTAPDPATETDYTYFRGMDGDTLPAGHTRSATVTDSRGDPAVTDSAQYAGLTYEAILYNGLNSGKVVNDTITAPWSSGDTASHALSGGLPAQQAFLTGQSDIKVFTPLASGATRETEIAYTHDSYGRVTRTDDKGDVSTTNDDLCTTASYADSTSAWILDLVDETRTVSVDCSATPALPADAVSDKRIFYDSSSTLGAAPTVGDPTSTQQATSYTGSTPVYTTMSSLTTDVYGRPLTSTDADQQTTKTSYTPTTGAAPTSIVSTDPLGQTLSQTYDALRGLTLTQTTAAGYVTKAQYDALGRTTAVFRPGIAAATTKYSYALAADKPSSVITQTLNEDGSYRSSELLLDSLLRPRETQIATVDGGRDVTDTVYDTNGWVAKTTAPYYASGAPSATLVQAQDGDVPSETGFTYDGAGRKTVATAYALGTSTWNTTTVFGGDFTTTLPPKGGVAETTLTDGRGRTTDLYQYHAGAAADPVHDAASDYSDTHYTYYPDGHQASQTDPGGNTWTWTYNLLGDQVAATDPDAGGSSATYDNAGQLLTTTDARGDRATYTYDKDGRKTAVFDTTGNATPSAANQVASWTYDTLKKGYLTSSTSYAMGTGSASVTNAVLGYTSMGDVAATKTTLANLPSDLAPLAPSGGYTESNTYKSSGLLASHQDPAGGGLPAETVDYGYDQYGQTTGIASSGTNAWTYVSAIGYDEYGEPLQYAMGPTTNWVDLTMRYDPQTGQPTDAKTTDSSSGTVVDDTSYAWENPALSKGAGLLASTTDRQNGGAVSDTQCFGYDWGTRLTAAWTATDSCAAAPSTGSGTVGGPSPYWQTWTYAADGERQTQTDHDTTGNTAGDTTTTYHYPTAGSATDQPHTLGSTTATGPAAAANSASYGYDASGNTDSIQGGALGDQTLTWNHQNRLDTDTTSAGTTSYLYGLDGGLVLRTDPTQATLYLGDEELVENTATKAVTGTRYYSVNGTTLASRSSSGDVQYLIPNRQGSDYLSIDYQTQAVTRRQYLPFGGTRGTVPAAWQGDKGYVGGTTDTTTSLVNLGIREYDPQTGRFISRDPQLETSDPSQLTGYDYAANDPVTGSDPTGQSWFHSLSNAVSSLADTAQQVIDRTNGPMAALGFGELLLGAGMDGLGGALMATGVGALGPGEALIAAGSVLAVSGTATVIASVAAPNVAYAVQNAGGGGGDDGDGSDGSSSEDPGRDEAAQSLVDEHKAKGRESQLTLDNAYRSLDGAPEGTRSQLLPEEHEYKNMPGYKNPDLEYLDQQGDVVGYGEVKTVGDASQKTFNSQLASAVKQLRVREDVEGKMDVNEIFIQVPDLADAREVKGWVRAYQKTRVHHGSDLEKVRGYHVRVYTESGSKLADFDLGIDADEGHVVDHTYYSPNGYSY
ncbi:RHS repeat-associated core domain-containing protein [Streptomyces polygonati]|uniref:RHS repeat-associated core domain-containing protein n=1 Tax=Streptomyces polygonati TaxID=1617087 RepID=A0ABV8HMX2_9ACTN